MTGYHHWIAAKRAEAERHWQGKYNRSFRFLVEEPGLSAEHCTCQMCTWCDCYKCDLVILNPEVNAKGE